MATYVGVAVFLIIVWILVKRTNMPKVATDDSTFEVKKTIKRLLKNKNYCGSVIAQFFYMGAQIGLWSYTIRYVMQELGKNENDASVYYLASIVVFSASRFVFTALMKFISPRKLLGIAASLGALCTVMVIYGNGLIGVLCLVGASACMSLMFPTIYGLGMQRLGKDSKIGGSGLIMAILGGAVLTGLQGMVSDSTGSLNLSFYVPLACFVMVIIYAAVQSKLSSYQTIQETK